MLLLREGVALMDKQEAQKLASEALIQPLWWFQAKFFQAWERVDQIGRPHIELIQVGYPLILWAFSRWCCSEDSGCAWGHKDLGTRSKITSEALGGTRRLSSSGSRTSPCSCFCPTQTPKRPAPMRCRSKFDLSYSKQCNEFFKSGFLILGRGREKSVFSQIKCGILWVFAYVFLVVAVGSLIFIRLSKRPERERLRKNSSSKVSCSSLLKRSKARFLERLDQLAVGGEPRAQTVGSCLVGVHAGQPGFSSQSYRLSLGPWDPLSSLLAPLPSQILTISFGGEHWVNSASKPGDLCQDISSLVSLVPFNQCPNCCPTHPPRFSQGLSLHFSWVYLVYTTFSSSLFSLFFCLP